MAVKDGNLVKMGVTLHIFLASQKKVMILRHFLECDIIRHRGEGYLQILERGAVWDKRNETCQNSKLSPIYGSWDL